MKKLLFACFALSVVASCKTKETKEVDSAPEAPETVAPPQSMPTLEEGCYTYDANGNRIVLEITEINSAVLGNLDYALKEKDANKGTFAGVLKDSVLLGSYTFMSEGTESTRQVAFLVKGDQLIEGFGALDETGTEFQDPTSLSFSSSMPLSKTDCEP
ncbi:hypothetical protein SAMN04487891_101334 [Flagellimonas taeanensis]|uniref:Uncharacterized protein n=1 Tax=Flagellimonas taeanensis TaxID=1005926 RepID=A0A1M6PVK5_9FLAO|nr:hypothetical protein [Allomuricauda taeanensis]SFB68059.1 hypothetical protein SAMN04487891_101334 [Allomuricauda taeanensis]SHK11936.1 hypothetical protein SAMN05216293_0338 [Allomuricauda taeanensis]